MMSKPAFYPLTLQTVLPVTKNATLLGFAVPEPLRAIFQFTPGQYLTLEAQIGERSVRRPYSICSTPQDNTLQVAIKHQQDGKFSTHARNLQAGDTVRVMPPSGRFMTPLGGEHRYTFIAAGSGITPIIAMVRSILQAEPNSHVTLIYGNPTAKDIMFLNPLENLKNQYIERFTLLHFLSREESDIPLFNGRIDTEKLATLNDAGVLQLQKMDGIYLCGPITLIEAITPWLVAQGIAQTRIHQEVFAPKNLLQKRAQRQAETTKTEAQDATSVQVILHGHRQEFDLKPDETLIEAAERHQIELPYSCNSGTCATCRCRLKGGKASMRQNYALEDWELERGFILACQTQPHSPEITLDFDEQ